MTVKSSSVQLLSRISQRYNITLRKELKNL
jgi:RNase P subunit RPR2